MQSSSQEAHPSLAYKEILDMVSHAMDKLKLDRQEPMVVLQAYQADLPKKYGQGCWLNS